MKKTFLGALCAIALTLGMTSCNNNMYVTFSDIKEVCVTYNDLGTVTSYHAIIEDDVFEISNVAYNVLTSESRKDTDIILFSYHHGRYNASISSAHTESIKLH